MRLTPTGEPKRLPPPPFWRTEYFANEVLGKPGRCRIDPLDIKRIIANPDRKRRQPDGRIQFWGWVPSLNSDVRVVTLADGETVHNAFRDRT
ncbi:hypothetical protein HHL28_03285 [Aerophototrophica crusticola]|uniref:Uncharacterized protein n=1 Tax=Aerophototrophica crusticola TaxID=1709002 RepID=A0A858R4Y8_9PROT|nr:hypothetical protein HHL28_03285 [Rhodospirillaceae bacterium B3]